MVYVSLIIIIDKTAILGEILQKHAEHDIGDLLVEILAQEIHFVGLWMCVFDHSMHR